MTRARSTTAGRDLATLFEAGAVGGGDDAELLRTFAGGPGTAAGEAAFRAILARHGPMVLGVCRRVVGDYHAADDAFQATFVILARKAHSIRVDGSLGGWLYGVSSRVARRARAVGRAARLRTRDVDGIDLPAPAAPTDLAGLAELRAVIDEEVARLPGPYRSAVVLCHFEGLSHDQAAARLRCPVGTVHSRLSRARDLLRTRLTRRGFAPAVCPGLARLTPRAAVPPRLVSATVFSARPAAGLFAAGVSALLNRTLGSRFMLNGLGVLTLTAAVGLAAARLAPGDDANQAAPPAAAKLGVKTGPEAVGTPTVADRFAAIKAEYEAKDRALWDEVGKGKDRREQNAIYTKMAPDQVDFARRMTDLAESAPKAPGSREALLWVLNKPGMSDFGPYGDQFGRAAALLVRHHGDDPDAVRIGLQLSNTYSPRRETLLLGFMAAAKSHESRGLARFALAQYLDRGARYAAAIWKIPGRRKMTLAGFVDDDGKVIDKEIDLTDEEYAFDLHLRLCDTAAMEAEAARLYEEVLRDYGDVPNRDMKRRELEALLKESAPTYNGKLLTDDERHRLAEIVARKGTLGKAVEALRDEKANIVIGKPAPEIRGVDFDGKPLSLSGHRGKVVVLVFWGSWCGPCVREIPHERELAARYEGRPFTLLGVDCNEEKTAGLEAIKKNAITWPNWHDGDAGPIVTAYHVSSYPTVFLIDAKGVIRSTHGLGPSFDETVETLVKEAETEASRGGAGKPPALTPRP